MTTQWAVYKVETWETAMGLCSKERLIDIVDTEEEAERLVGNVGRNVIARELPSLLVGRCR